MALAITASTANTSAEAATLIGATVTLFEMPVYYADWPQRRTATIVLELEPVGTILSEFREESGMQIIIRYPGGDLGNAWALEFQGWLVAFGVPSHYIILAVSYTHLTLPTILRV